MPTTIVTGTSKANLNYAARRRAEILQKIADKEFDYALEFPNSKNAYLDTTRRYTGKDLFLKLIARYETAKLKPSTVTTYRNLITSKLIPFFGSRYIDQINADTIRLFVKAMPPLTKKSHDQIMIHLKVMLDYALNDGFIKKHPFNELAINKLIDDVAFESDNEVIPFIPEEQERILAACDKPLIKYYILLALNSGMRPGEMISLQWEDIDDEFINVGRNKVKGGLTTPKTDSGNRRILILPKARLALNKLREITGKEKYVFVGYKGPWQSSDAFYKHWEKILQKANVQYKVPYQLRHSYASMLLSNGENPLWVASQMGHITTEMITKIYGKWIPSSDDKLGYKLKGNY